MAIFEHKALNNLNILEYLKLKFPQAKDIQQKEIKIISDVKPLLQNDYGGTNDCTLTAITTIINQDLQLPPEIIYPIVENNARKWGFRNDGTNPLFAPFIFTKSYKECNAINYKTTMRPFKEIGWNYNTIKKNINNNKPMMLSTPEDGRHYYINHSITIIGYCTFQVDNKEIPFLCIYDNWEAKMMYIDYQVLSCISTIYFKI